MTIELDRLTLGILMAAILWVPYVLNRLVVRGLLGALKLSDPNSTLHSDWAERGIRAYKKAVENLVIFCTIGGYRSSYRCFDGPDNLSDNNLFLRKACQLHHHNTRNSCA